MSKDFLNLLKSKKLISDADAENKTPEEILKIKEKICFDVCYKIMEIFENEPNIVYTDCNPVICGDLHGNFDDMLLLFDKYGYPPATYYVFLGDLIDRGNNSIFVALFLFTLKLLYPSHIIIIRGNHENPVVNSKYHFLDECLEFFNKTTKAYHVFNRAFSYFPLACLIQGSILCIHGGISEKIKTLEEINAIDRFQINPKDEFADLLWSDPIPTFPYQSENERNHDFPFYEFNDERRCAAFFTGQGISQFLERNGIKCIIRGHESVKTGYRVDYNETLFTINPFHDSKHKYFYVIQIKQGKPEVQTLIDEEITEPE